MKLVSEADWVIDGTTRRLAILDYDARVYHQAYDDPDSPWQWIVELVSNAKTVKKGRCSTLVEAKDAAEFAIAYHHRKKRAA